MQQITVEVQESIGARDALRHWRASLGDVELHVEEHSPGEGAAHLEERGAGLLKAPLQHLWSAFKGTLSLGAVGGVLAGPWGLAAGAVGGLFADTDRWGKIPVFPVRLVQCLDGRMLAVWWVR